MGNEVLLAPTRQTDPVYSVVFSPCGTRIVSGSRDETIRLWDAKSGEEVIPAMQGSLLSGVHSRRKFIISGSADRTVRIWNATQGGEVRSPLVGHTDRVWTVTVSLDSACIASSSADTTFGYGTLLQALPPPEL